MDTIFTEYRAELNNELENILDYWSRKMKDEANGGFYGRIDGRNVLHPLSEKGSVLNARILWTFSAAYNLTLKREYLDIALTQYNYIKQYFFDAEFGGVYWSVDYKGNPVNARKQIYGQAFVLYALSEFYMATKNTSALTLAVELFHLIEKYSYDEVLGGYFEAFTRDWKLESDLRLSDKDENEKKTMNTHLHVIEGYAALYRVWKDQKLKVKILHLLSVFSEKIFNSQTKHLELFFDEQWNNHHHIISYGHDIEAGWLLQDAAEIIEDTAWVDITKGLALDLTNGCFEALDEDGGLWYERTNTGYVYEKHWWPQAEAMVGFFNMYENSSDKKYLRQSLNSWHFVQQKLLDTTHGEWYWGIDKDGSIMEKEDKAGFWKCPYHNGRACIEIIKRINKLES